MGVGSLPWTNARLNWANVRDWFAHGGPVVGPDCDSGTASNDPMAMNETRPMPSSNDRILEPSGVSPYWIVVTRRRLRLAPMTTTTRPDGRAQCRVAALRAGRPLEIPRSRRE